MSKDYEHWPGRDKRYKAFGLKDDQIPTSESLEEVSERAMSYWHAIIEPQIKKGKRILIVSHGNTIRSMIKKIDNLSEEAIVEVSIPRAWPLVYTFDRETLQPIRTPHRKYEFLSGHFLGDQDVLEKTMWVSSPFMILFFFFNTK